MVRLVALLAVCCFSIGLNGQGNLAVDSMYNNAMQLYKKNETFEAITELEKVVKADPVHRDALFNLGLIYHQLKVDATAIDYLKRCVKLRDEEAKRLLKDQFHVSLSYADTMQVITESAEKKYKSIKNDHFETLDALTKRILSVSIDQKEQLQLLLLWTCGNMRADSSRFFRSGFPLSVGEAFKARKGLCEEFSGMLYSFCKAAGIKCIRVPGYVKYPNFTTGSIFTETNHIWNAIYVGEKWLLCDLFWSASALVVDTSGSHFMRMLTTDYYLAIPSEFGKDHLPADPVFQFTDRPVSMKAFVSKRFKVDSSIERMHYINQSDSLQTLLKLPSQDRDIRMAWHAYQYNPQNPDDLIVSCYNRSVDILNNKKSPDEQLRKARSYLVLALSIMDKSSNADVKGLEGTCRTALVWLNKHFRISQ